MSDRHRAMADQLLRAHGELRAELARLRSGGELTLNRDLVTHCLTFCDSLGEHHTKEDSAFGTIETEFPDLAPALDRLRAEHHVVAETLAELRRLLSSGVPVRAELDRLAGRLENHFEYEERQLLSRLRG